MMEVKPMDQPLGPREERILLDLMALYRRSREPVSSRALAEAHPEGPSPATLRNILARLEEMGYLHQPTSVSGRIPTDEAYRYLAAAVLRCEGGREVHPSWQEVLRLAEDGSLAGVARSLPPRLSGAVRLLAFAVTPSLETLRIRACDLVSLAPDRVLFVLVAEGGQVRERVVRTPEPLGPDTLRWCANYLSQTFAGCTLAEVRRRLRLQLAAERERLGREVAAVLDAVGPCFEENQPVRELFWEGAPWLLDDPALQEQLDAVRYFLEALERKTRLLNLLEALFASGETLRVVLGGEWGDVPVEPLAMVLAPFGGEERGRGWVGIVGPKTLPYDTAIPAVRETALLATLAAETL
jgi:heat-inducible transcriptional repressor